MTTFTKIRLVYLIFCRLARRRNTRLMTLASSKVVRAGKVKKMKAKL